MNADVEKRHGLAPAPTAARETPPHPLQAMPDLEVKAAPFLADADAEAFVAVALEDLVDCHIPFLLAGTFALSAYTGITRQTKDLDIFCKAGDYARILSHF
ncbi:MAG: hypothetical protein EOP17_09335, partial [Rhizobiaceae bacterium]